MIFTPAPSRSKIILLAATLLGALLTLASVDRLFRQTEPPGMFLALAVTLTALAATLLLGYLALIVFNVRYKLNRNGLTIYWGVNRQRIPFNHIRQIVPATERAGEMAFQGINLGGLRLGRGVLRDHGPLQFKGTGSIEQSLLVITPERAYLVSPAEPARLLKAWADRQPLGPTQQWHEDTRPLRPFNTPLLTDQLAWSLIAGGVLLLIGLLGYISLNYPELPGALPIHFDSLGRADRIAPKVFLFTLPAVGGIVWLTNFLLGSLIYRRERLGAYLLWGSTAAVQLSLWVALFTITGV
ncbi:MAG: hypothetical protein Kow0031_02220 [Anaerolineae bacterium]